MDALHRVVSHALHGGGVLDRGGKEVAAAAASVSEEETVDERAVVLGGAVVGVRGVRLAHGEADAVVGFHQGATRHIEYIRWRRGVHNAARAVRALGDGVGEHGGGFYGADGFNERSRERWVLDQSDMGIRIVVDV
jgi:hypothetical protein